MLDWEENVFVGLKAVYNRLWVRPRERHTTETRVTLKEQRGSLLHLGRMLSGRDVTLFETDDPALFVRDRICLPAELTVGPSRESNRALYELRTITAALALRHQWSIQKTDPTRTSSRGLQEGITHHAPRLPDLLAGCFDEFPGLPEKIDSLERSLGLNGEFWNVIGRLPETRSLRESSEGQDLVVQEPEADDAAAVTEIEGRGQPQVEVLPEETLNGPENNLPEHVFEKTETLEEYNGLLRKSEDDESLEDHEEALREVDMRHLVRTPERPRSIYRADVMLDGLCFETDDNVPGTGIPYPEWDYRKGSYKRDWCFLTEAVQVDNDSAWPSRIAAKHRRLIHRLKSQFNAMTSEWLRLKSQPNGDEFDLDAVINSHVERLTGHTPSENVHLHRRRDLHDIAVLILLDQSYSTDAWLNDTRVLDTITESIFCVGEVVEEYIETFAVAGFSSNTRRACRFNVLKDFHERWPQVRDRLGAVQPSGYTRIGPALRHAQERLLNRKARRKMVILLTDGRPCDYDRYEGKHGIHDVKKALETGLQHGIHGHAFAIEKQAAEYFPQMFLGRHFDILPNPNKLGDALTRLFSRLIAS